MATKKPSTAVNRCRPVPPPMETQTVSTATDQVAHTLAVRGSRYGTFISNAVFSQRLKDMFREVAAENPHYQNLSETQSAAIFEFVDQTAQKLCRLANGDPLYLDNIHDIQGYGKLAEEFLATDGGWK